MNGTSDIAVVVIIAFLVMLLLIGTAVLSLIIVYTRRHKHRSELAELQLQRDQEVIAAEREATQQTLGEVGRELHDNVGQLLTVARIGLTAVLDDGAADGRLHASLSALEDGIEEVRRLGRTLNSDTWHDRSFLDAVSTEAARVERVGRIGAPLLITGPPPEFPPDTKTVLFRVFQEIMSNSLRHAKATTIRIALDGGPPFVLRVQDNGTGFAETQAGSGSGLANIRRRCALIGFRAELVTAPGAGCTWIIQHRSSDAA